MTAHGFMLILHISIEIGRCHEARFNVVVPLNLEVLHYRRMDLLREDRRSHLDTTIEVARHKVGTEDIALRLTAIVADYESCVFEEFIDNAAHLDIFAKSLDSRIEATSTSHQEFDPNSLARGFVEEFDHVDIGQGVELAVEICFLPTLGLLDLALEDALDLVAHVIGRQD